MIKELTELGIKIRQQKEADGEIVHNALCKEPISIDLIINQDGSFYKFEVIEKIFRTAEAIKAKKGKARLLLDKAEEVLCYNDQTKKHELFIEKLTEYRSLPELEPVFLFYNKKTGLDAALASFENQVNEKDRNGNIAFRVIGDDCRIHEKPAVYRDIINKFEEKNKQLSADNSRRCSICGSIDHPVEDLPHGMIKRVPDGQPTGCALVSYNEKVFESYGLKGNLNSSICINCASKYTEALNYLLSNGVTTTVQDKKGTFQEQFYHTNRKNFGSDTAMIYWTKNNDTCSELDLFDNPDASEVKKLINSVVSGNADNHLNADYFYSCTLSGAAARIAVRDWIELSLVDLKNL